MCDFQVHVPVSPAVEHIVGDGVTLFADCTGHDGFCGRRQVEATRKEEEKKKSRFSKCFNPVCLAEVGGI